MRRFFFTTQALMKSANLPHWANSGTTQWFTLVGGPIAVYVYEMEEQRELVLRCPYQCSVSGVV